MGDTYSIYGGLGDGGGRSNITIFKIEVLILAMAGDMSEPKVIMIEGGEEDQIALSSDPSDDEQ